MLNPGLHIIGGLIVGPIFKPCVGRGFQTILGLLFLNRQKECQKICQIDPNRTFSRMPEDVDKMFLNIRQAEYHKRMPDSTREDITCDQHFSCLDRWFWRCGSIRQESKATGCWANSLKRRKCITMHLHILYILTTHWLYIFKLYTVYIHVRTQFSLKMKCKRSDMQRTIVSVLGRTLFLDTETTSQGTTWALIWWVFLGLCVKSLAARQLAALPKRETPERFSDPLTGLLVFSFIC